MDKDTWNYIGMAAVAVITFLGTKGLQYLDTWRKGSREETTYQDGRITKGYDIALAAERARIDVLETALKAERAASEAQLEAARLREDECQRKATEMAAKVAALEKEVQILKSESWARERAAREKMQGDKEPKV